MPFTKAQRLKGLKKQLKNLGFDVVSSSGRDASPSPADVEVEASPTEDAEHQLASMKARQEAW